MTKDTHEPALLLRSILLPLMLHRRQLVPLSAAAFLAACSARLAPTSTVPATPLPADGAFTMADGARLPYRTWFPVEMGAGVQPWAVVLALHGFNDSRDAWEIPAPFFTAGGVAFFAPDQRGFGEAPGRGLWPGTPTLVADAATMARELRRRFPKARLFLMGESMGGAVLMRLATDALAPPIDGYICLAPAVWGRAEMNVFLRGTLWAASHLFPSISVGNGPIRVRASDNMAALIRLSTDPLTLHETRVDTLRGLVDLMDAALAAAPRFRQPSLFLYGAKDELVPSRATATTWRGLEDAESQGTRIAYYSEGYHLLLRDFARSKPLGDVLSWMNDPSAPLPSGADRAAQAWLVTQH